MEDGRYERPRIEDRTTVTEPLNTINASHGGIVPTPTWRSHAAEDEPAAAYEPPEVAEHTPVIEPLNTVTNSTPVLTPTWRAKRDRP